MSYKDIHVGINLDPNELNKLERIKYRIGTKTYSNTIRTLINAYYMQFIMGKENKDEDSIIKRYRTIDEKKTTHRKTT